MNMFLHELKAYRKSTIIWTGSLVGLIIMFLSIFPSFSKDIEGMKTLLEGYPEAVRKAFGLTLESFSSILGFYSYIFTYVTLCGSIQAINLGLSIVSKEARDKTADFLLTKPVTRKQIITAKLLAVLTSIIITNIIYIIVASIMASFVATTDFDIELFIMISITMFFMQLMFMSLGVLISVIVPKLRSVISISLGTVFSFYIINMFNSVVGGDVLKYITPFKYYDTAYIMKNTSYETSFVIIEILFIAVSIGMSYFIYSKKDIHAV
ncbi:ABC transporter permease subunit [Clostridium vincentii]|uniref:ABC-2 family transporter protein n=1 Tax=Clostridium vincentii TaxID=52704 RepID=A0A2T0BIE7_9CLOT|nr:ABC transporter permease subunit [Clostridium vincentii]PRR83644.1 ABC-2 family transporter protein [Clostridium vincentii]